MTRMTVMRIFGSIPTILPKGFQIAIFAVVPGARSITLGPEGTIFVGSGGLSNETKRVYVVQDLNKDFIADKVTVLADGLNMPNGVAYRDGDLYVAEVEKLSRYKNVMSNFTNNPKPENIPVTFPSDKHHGWKFIRFDKNGRLYVPVGAPCNVCSVSDAYSRIFRIDVKTGKKEMVAQGVRNSVGFDFHPVTGDLWFTDNGRDMLGDDVPPDELNHLITEGTHFGFPHCHGNNIIDPDFPKKEGCKTFTSPAHLFPAHIAPLGMRFYTGTQFPSEYKNQIFVAEHGSWNRSIPQGYRLSLVECQIIRKIPNTKFLLKDGCKALKLGDDL